MQASSSEKTFTTNQPSAFVKIVAILFSCFLSASPAFAQLTRVNSTMSNVQVALAGIGVTVCTIAIMFTGFKMMFQHAKWAEVSNIVIGAMFVGGAAGLAAWLIN